jgi:CheY-like chemotaxis protein
MENEMNPLPPEPAAQPQAQNQPNEGGGGGRRRRRRRRKKGGGGTQAQPNGQQAMGQGQPQHRQGRPPHQQQPGGRRGGAGGHRRGRMRRQPAFVGPMDHSYRAASADNVGNYDPGYVQRRPAPMINGNGNAQATFEAAPAPAIREDAPTRIFCFIEDLFFYAKINEISRKLGIKVKFVKTAEEVLERAEDDVPENERPQLIVFDLNNANVKPLTVIPKLKAKLKKSASIIGFLSHVQGDLKVKAQEAGCDMVVPRSAFSANLPNILRRHSEDEVEE